MGTRSACNSKGVSVSGATTASGPKTDHKVHKVHTNAINLIMQPLTLLLRFLPKLVACCVKWDPNIALKSALLRSHLMLISLFLLLPKVKEIPRTAKQRAPQK